MVRQFVICVVLALLRPPAISCCYRCYHLLRSKLEQSVLDCWCWDLATQRQTVATEVYWSTEIRHNSVEIFSVLILELEFKSVRTPDRPDLIPTEERQNSKCQLSSVKYYCRNNHDKTREMAARQIFDRKLCQKFGKKNLVKWHPVKRSRNNCVEKTRQLKVRQKKVAEKVARWRNIFLNIENEESRACADMDSLWQES